MSLPACALEKHGDTPMHLAAKHGHADVVSALLTAGASYEATDADGSKPLLLAAHFGKTTCCEILMAAGADPNLFHPNTLGSNNPPNFRQNLCNTMDCRGHLDSCIIWPG